MSKLLLHSAILVASVFAHSETYASSPATVTCATCKTDTDFWTYGAGYIESNHGGAFATFTRNDRVIVQNLDNVRYMIDVDSVTSTACFIYCISYDQRGKWEVTFQNLNGSPAKVVETFLHVLRKNFEKLQKRETQALKEAKEKERKPDQTSQYYYNKYLQTDAYKQRQSFIQETNNRWQRMLDWKFILRTKYNDHRTICSPTYSGVRCDRYSRNFNGY